MTERGEGGRARICGQVSTGPPIFMSISNCQSHLRKVASWGGSWRQKWHSIHGGGGSSSNMEQSSRRGIISLRKQELSKRSWWCTRTKSQGAETYWERREERRGRDLTVKTRTRSVCHTPDWLGLRSLPHHGTETASRCPGSNFGQKCIFPVAARIVALPR